jgi:multisubunit Na+/H+ antiporter MnhB subunit
MSATPAPAPTPKQKLPRLAYNPISAVGAALAVVAGLTFLVLLGLSFYSPQASPYFGIFMYMALPPLLVVGLLLIPLGMTLRRRRFRKTGQLPSEWPRIDLNEPRHRNAAVIFVVGTLALTIIMSISSYGAYHYSESVKFCGTTCHTVMQPEYVTYQNSPHARVACTACHVGPGADWYVKSKLSGVYQIYAVARDIYPRPIDTPIESLRPAQQTCEQCHWPEKIYGAQQRLLHHYKYDDAEHSLADRHADQGRRRRLRSRPGRHPLAHEHRRRRALRRPRREAPGDPWIEVRDEAPGRVHRLRGHREAAHGAGARHACGQPHDCMDCHNRPSHTYQSPDSAIDVQAACAARSTHAPGHQARSR